MITKETLNKLYEETAYRIAQSKLTRNEKFLIRQALKDYKDELIKMETELYYTAPTDKAFEELKLKAMELWVEIDKDNDKYGYATGKINRIKDLKNIGDNFMYIIAMFDIFNIELLRRKLSKETKKEVCERLESVDNSISFLFKV